MLLVVREGLRKQVAKRDEEDQIGSFIGFAELD